jgi:predicted small lipoprotein YifL
MVKGKRRRPIFMLRLFVLPLVLLLLSACGQPGPLYLPSSKPPIYVEPEPVSKPETKGKEGNPALSPSPENKQPETDQ